MDGENLCYYCLLPMNCMTGLSQCVPALMIPRGALPGTPWQWDEMAVVRSHWYRVIITTLEQDYISFRCQMSYSIAALDTCESRSLPELGERTGQGPRGPAD